MTQFHGIRLPVVSALVLALAIGGALAASASPGAAQPGATAGKPAAAGKAAPGKAGAQEAGKSGEKEAGKRAAAERKKIIEEAVTALARVNLALRHLDQGKTDEALEDLAVAVGKLDLVVARSPELTLAPVDVRVITHDLKADVEEIRRTVREAQEALDDGEVQRARRMLADLGSEIIVRVYNIPLATWPDAIKKVAPLVDQGKIEEAKRALQQALSTIVIVDSVIPLPVVRAQAWLAKARDLAQKKDRSAQEEKDLSGYLDRAQHQLELAEALGYGDRDDYKAFYDTIAEIRRRTEGGGTETGLFERLRRSLEEFRRKL